MKKLNMVASLFASVALAATVSSAFAADNWTSGTGLNWTSGTGNCWRDIAWSPASASPNCDGAPKPAAAAPAPAPAPAPVAAPAPAAAPAAAAPAPVAAPKPPAPPAPPPAPVSEKVSFASDAFYDIGKAVLKADAKAKLEDLVSKMTGVNLEVIIAVGHTDSDGSDAANEKLSLARAESVKAFLVSKGIEANRVYTEGKGEKQPVADNKTKDGKAKNRRVEIEVVGTRTRK